MGSHRRTSGSLVAGQRRGELALDVEVDVVADVDLDLQDPAAVEREAGRVLLADRVAGVVAEGALKTQPGHFALDGEGLTIGRDSSDPVSKEYPAGFDFTGGRIIEVEVNIGDDVYLDVERDLAAAMARD